MITIISSKKNSDISKLFLIVIFAQLEKVWVKMIKLKLISVQSFLKLLIKKSVFTYKNDCHDIYG